MWEENTAYIEPIEIAMFLCPLLRIGPWFAAGLQIAFVRRFQQRRSQPL